MSTEALGIAQTDIIIRTAIIAAIRDLRDNPWLLNYIFRSLAEDSLTSNVYGEKDIAQAKKWFLSTDIPVFMSTRLDEVKLPCISINLMESAEAEETHSDTHYITHEDSSPDLPVVFGPFSPKSYDAVTGTMELPSNITASVSFNTGMFVVDSSGAEHAIVDVLSQTNIVLTPGTFADFTGAIIKDPSASLTVTLESMQFRETIQVGCHVQSESIYLTYLHSIMVFILAGRYKQALLEARGFERSTISSSQFLKNEALGVENAYSRFINLTGYVRNYWPKFIDTKVTEVLPGISVGTNGSNGPPGINDSGALQTEDDSWGVDVDALSLMR